MSSMAKKQDDITDDDSKDQHISVPGRLCLFGEHADWAGTYRRFNSDIPIGRSIVVGTNEQLHARVSRHRCCEEELSAPAEGKLTVHCVVAPSSASSSPPSASASASSSNKRAKVGDGSAMVSTTNTCNSNSNSNATATERQTLEVALNDADELLRIAQEGGFWSYVCGVVYELVTRYHCTHDDVVIDQYRCDLPVKKGLSSSAAICVLVARAFNVLFKLKLTTRGEMDLAYHGEILTPSRCGRLDQACAYGPGRSVLLTFDGDMLTTSELPSPSSPIYIVIVDLHAHKDTKIILGDLQRAYPFPATSTTTTATAGEEKGKQKEKEKSQHDIHIGIHRLLGEVNLKIIDEAVAIISSASTASTAASEASGTDASDAGGSAAERLGRLMTHAQQQFDELAQPACPSQLTAPKLHRILHYAAIQQWVWGGKGVGSQGDGTAQLVVKNHDAMTRVCEVLERECDVTCLTLTLGADNAVDHDIDSGSGSRVAAM